MKTVGKSSFDKLQHAFLMCLADMRDAEDVRLKAPVIDPAALEGLMLGTLEEIAGEGIEVKNVDLRVGPK